MRQTIKSVLKHSIVYGIGDILAKVVGFLLIPLYTHYFSTEQYGTLELLDLCSHIITFFLAMGISEAMVRFYFDSKDPKFRDQVVSVSLIATWMLSLIGTALLLPNARFVSELVFQDPEKFHYFHLLFVSIALMICNEVPLQLLRIEQRSMLYTIVSLIRLSIQLSLNIYFIVALDLGVMGILWSTFITNVILGVGLTWSVIKRIHFSFSWPLFKEMFRYGYPLIGTWFGNFLLHFADRFLLQRLGSLSQVGVYALSYKFGFLVNIFILGPFKKTWMPKQFEVVEEENAKAIFARVFTYYMFVQFYFTLGVSLLIEDVLKIIAEAKFHEAHLYVPLLLLAYNFNGVYHFLEFALLYKKRTRQLALITISCGIINIIANALLIPQFAVWGATWATFISFFCLALWTAIAGQRLFYIPLEYRRVATMMLVGLTLFFLGRLLVFDSVITSIASRFFLAASFPAVLLLFGFLDEDERGFIRDAWRDRARFQEQLQRLFNKAK